MSKNIFYTVVYFHTVFMTCLSHHIDSTERFDGTSQQFICLQADD